MIVKRPYSNTMRSFQLARIPGVDTTVGYSDPHLGDVRLVFTGDVLFDLNLDDRVWPTQIAMNTLALKPVRIQDRAKRHDGYQRVATAFSPGQFIEASLTTVIEYAKFLKSPQILSDAMDRFQAEYMKLTKLLQVPVVTRSPVIVSGKDNIARFM